jgi:hypothetical protein
MLHIETFQYFTQVKFFPEKVGDEGDSEKRGMRKRGKVDYSARAMEVTDKRPLIQPLPFRSGVNTPL